MDKHAAMSDLWLLGEVRSLSRRPMHLPIRGGNTGPYRTTPTLYKIPVANELVYNAMEPIHLMTAPFFRLLSVNDYVYFDYRLSTYYLNAVLPHKYELMLELVHSHDVDIISHSKHSIGPGACPIR